MECLDGKQRYHALVDTNAIYILVAKWQTKVQKETANKEHAQEDSEMWLHRLTVFRKPMRKGKYGRVTNIDVILSRSTFGVIHLVP